MTHDLVSTEYQLFARNHAWVTVVLDQRVLSNLPCSLSRSVAAVTDKWGKIGNNRAELKSWVRTGLWLKMLI